MAKKPMTGEVRDRVLAAFFMIFEVREVFPLPCVYKIFNIDDGTVRHNIENRPQYYSIQSRYRFIIAKPTSLLQRVGPILAQHYGPELIKEAARKLSELRVAYEDNPRKTIPELEETLQLGSLVIQHWQDKFYGQPSRSSVSSKI